MFETIFDLFYFVFLAMFYQMFWVCLLSLVWCGGIGQVSGIDSPEYIRLKSAYCGLMEGTPEWTEYHLRQNCLSSTREFGEMVNKCFNVLQHYFKLLTSFMVNFSRVFHQIFVSMFDIISPFNLGLLYY